MTSMIVRQREDPEAEDLFDSQPVERPLLEWISAAKTPGTREKRVVETATKAAHNVRANEWRQPKGVGARD